MKKLSIAITLALLMCLTMVFPSFAAATVYDSSLDAAIKVEFDKYYSSTVSKVPVDYKYYLTAYYNGRFKKFYYSKKEIISAGDTIYEAGDNGKVTSAVVEKFSLGYSSSDELNFTLRTSYSYSTTLTGVILNYSTANISDDAINLMPSNAKFYLSTLDMTALQSLITTAKAKTNTGYTSVSWQALQTAITNAENLFNKVGGTQLQVDNAKNTLQSALNGLVLLPDRTTLQSLVTTAKSKTNTGYTSASWQALQTAITAAQSVLNITTDYTQAQVDNAKNTLQSALNGLVLLPDRTALQSLVTTAKAKTNIGYTSTSWQALQTAITAAQSVLNITTDYTQAQVDNAKNTLQSALDGLVPLPNTTALQSLITTAKAKTNTGYTSVSWQALQAAIIDADNLIKTANYTQAQVTSATNSLQTALDGLVLLPNTTALQSLIVTAKSKAESDYTALTWQALQTAIIAAESLLRTTDYTLSQVNNVTSSLQNALDCLVLISDVTALQSLISTTKIEIETNYTVTSWRALQVAMTAAENLLKETDYTQTQLNDITNALQSAFDSLALLPDATEIQSFVLAAKLRTDKDYTPESWEALQLAITTVESLLETSDYTQEQLNEVINALQSALDALVLVEVSIVNSNTLEPVLQGSKNSIGVILIIGIGLFGILFGISFIPISFKKFKKG